jgi:uncharacterized protein YndB with AHSA1/START domain
MFKYSGAAVSGLIAAPVEAVWELVSDVARHPAIAGSGEVRGIRVVGDGPLGLGGVFESRQNLRGIKYVTASRVVIWEPPHRFAWRVGLPGAPGRAQTWMFSLRPEAGGTRLENGVALIYAFPSLPPFSLARAQISRRYAGSIHPTLRNVAAILGAPAPSDVVERLEPPPALAAFLPPPATLPAVALAGGATLLLAAYALRRGAR